MKVHILILRVPNIRLTCMQGQKHFHCLICIYFYFNCSMINFSKSLLCVTLLCSDWSIPFKAVQCYFVYSVTVETAPKAHLVAKNEFAFSFRPMRKDQQVGGEYANDSCWCQTGIGFKNDSFQWFRVDSLFWENNFIHGALSDLTLFRCFHSLTHCMKDHLQ